MLFGSYRVKLDSYLTRETVKSSFCCSHNKINILQCHGFSMKEAKFYSEAVSGYTELFKQLMTERKLLGWLTSMMNG